MRNKVLTLILAITLLAAPLYSFGEKSDVKQGSLCSSESYVPGEVIVSFTDDLSLNKEKKIIRDAVSEKSKITSIDDNFVLVESKQGVDTAEMIEALEDDPKVESVQPNYYYTAEDDSDEIVDGVCGTTPQESFCNDPKIQGAWYMDYIGIPEAWDAVEKYQTDGTIKDPSKRVKIATIDSGAYLVHKDQDDITNGGNFDTEYCKTVLEGREPTDDPYPCPSLNHGNSTSSVIGATSNNGKGIAGIAAGNHNDIAAVMAVNVFRDTIDSVHKATSADVCKGIEYACENGARVIMMCLGHKPGAMDGLGDPIDDAAVEAKINWATYEMDVVCVASAGNKNSTKTWYPSDFDACMSVINTGQYTDIESKKCKAETSNYGPLKDISAPGEGVFYCTKSKTGCSAGSGTSFSASIAASIAGLVRYVDPDLTQQEVKDIIYATATDLYTPGFDDYTAWGNINAYAAVTAAAKSPCAVKPEKLDAVKGLRVRSSGKKSLDLSWDAAECDRYEIYRKAGKGSKYKLVNITGETTWTDEGLKFNKKYMYIVVARGTSLDGKLVFGKKSAAVSAKPVCGPASIQDVNIRNEKKDRVAWSKAKNASGYMVYAAKAKKGKYMCVKTIKGSDKLACIIKKEKPGKKYYYKVRPYVMKKGKIYYGRFSSAAAYMPPEPDPGSADVYLPEKR